MTVDRAMFETTSVVVDGEPVTLPRWMTRRYGRPGHVAGRGSPAASPRLPVRDADLSASEDRASAPREASLVRPH